MKKPVSKKVQFGICDKCFQNLSDRSEFLRETFLDVCIYHMHSKKPVSKSLLEDKYSIHFDYLIKQLEIENYITSHETDQGVFILPRIYHKYGLLPIYCSNRFTGCSRIVLEQNYND